MYQLVGVNRWQNEEIAASKSQAVEN